MGGIEYMNLTGRTRSNQSLISSRCHLYNREPTKMFCRFALFYKMSLFAWKLKLHTPSRMAIYMLIWVCFMNHFSKRITSYFREKNRISSQISSFNWDWFFIIIVYPTKIIFWWKKSDLLWYFQSYH